MDTIKKVLIGFETTNKEYKIISDRAEELKESVRNLLIPDYYEEWDKLFTTIELQHEMELKEIYKKGIRQGAFVQKVICCDNCIGDIVTKADENI